MQSAVVDLIRMQSDACERSDTHVCQADERRVTAHRSSSPQAAPSSRPLYPLGPIRLPVPFLSHLITSRPAPLLHPTSHSYRMEPAAPFERFPPDFRAAHFVIQAVGPRKREPPFPFAREPQSVHCEELRRRRGG